MAKTAKLKHDPASNPRSRASKRQTSPSINTDKSLKDVPIPTPTPTVLAPRPNAGITKIKPKNRRLRGNAKSSKQKRREEKKMERAEAVMDRMEVKVKGAAGRVRRRKERKGQWEGVNGETKMMRRERLGFGAEADEEGDSGEEGKMEDVQEEGGETFVPAVEVQSPEVARNELEETAEEDKIT